MRLYWQLSKKGPYKTGSRSEILLPVLFRSICIKQLTNTNKNMQLRKSSKKQAKIKLAMQGPAGSGKTMSALLLAYGLCGDWTKIAVIDSENNSADLYAHLGQYNVLPLEGKYAPETYIDAIKVCEKAGMEVIIIDSMSQCWDNLLEYHACLPGNSFTNWQKVTPRMTSLIQMILGVNCHVISTMRCKQDYVMSEKNGKMVPEKVGLNGKGA